MTRLTAGRAIATTLAVLGGFAGQALWAAPAQADPVRQYQWYLTPLKMNQVQQITRGAGVIVAVVDTPVFAAHRDLAGQLLQGTTTAGGPANGWGEDNIANAHGTEVASVIAGKGGGDDHMLGIAPGAKILPVAVGSGSHILSKDASAGIRWAADHGAKVINVSNGHTGAAIDAELDAIRYAVSKDVVVVAGVGNTSEGMQSVISPANVPGVVAVSGVNADGDFWPGSASGPETVLAAPGSQMSVASVSANFPSGYGLAEGTSLSTAIVSGVAALVRAKYPQLNAANVINRLIRTARDNGDPGRDKYFGFGTIQPLAALTADVAAVNDNPLGAVPATTPGASAPAKVHPPARADMGRVAILLAVGAGVVVTLIVVLMVAVRAARRRSAPPPAPPWAGPPAGFPPQTGPPGGFPPQRYPPPPPPGNYAPPSGDGTGSWNRP